MTKRCCQKFENAVKDGRFATDSELAQYLISSTNPARFVAHATRCCYCGARYPFTAFSKWRRHTLYYMMLGVIAGFIVPLIQRFL